MIFGSGTKQVMREALMWLIAIGIAIGSFVFYKDVSRGLSHIIQIAEDYYRDNMTSDAKQTPSPKNNGFLRKFTVKADNRGHFKVNGEINGYSVAFLADTGATFVSLTYETAEKLGLNPDNLRFSARSRTANGIAKSAPVILDRLSVGHISVKNVKAFVSEPGKLHINLLGMSFMSRLRRVEMQDRKILFIQ